MKIDAIFIYLKIEKLNRILKFISNKTFIIIELKRLYTINNIFNEINLSLNENIVIFNDEIQNFDKENKENEFNIVLRMKFKFSKRIKK